MLRGLRARHRGKITAALLRDSELGRHLQRAARLSTGPSENTVDDDVQTFCSALPLPLSTEA